MTQKTQAQAVAEHLIPIVDRNPARSNAAKRDDLTATEFLRQIRDGEQYVVSAEEYERFRQWQQQQDAAEGEE